MHAVAITNFWGLFFLILTIADEEEEKSKKARSESWQC